MSVWQVIAQEDAVSFAAEDLDELLGSFVTRYIVDIDTNSLAIP